ncbi:MAG: hypothetical protein KC900_11730 [Candidatus Omnitrophica bacterium]|nr:hypothetical protein [Candidatus Omnitrophota bacterium]
MSKTSFLSFLALPEASQLSENLDDVSTTLVHRRILQRKPFLRQIYSEFYQMMRALAPGFSYPLVKGLGYLLTPLHGMLGMFMTAELEYRPAAGS